MQLLRALWARRHDRPWFVAVTLVTVGLLAVYPAVDAALRATGVAPEFQFWDFGAYRQATGRLLRGESIYVRNDEGGFHGTYIYPPLVLAAFLPFGGLTFDAAALAWVVLGVVFLWWALGQAVAALGYRLSLAEWLALGWLVVGFQPVLLTVKMGQTATFLAGGLALAVALAATDEPGGAVASGLLTALVACVKLPYAPAGAHLLTDRRRLVGAVVGGLAFLAASLAAFGVGPNRTFLAVLRWGVEHGTTARSPRIWLPPYFRPFYGVPNPTVARLAVAGVIAATAAITDADRAAFALGAASVPLLAPQTYTYYTVACLPAAVVLLAGELDRSDGRPALVVVGVLLLAVHSYGTLALGEVLPAFPAWATAANLLIQPALWGVWLLVGLAWLRTARGVSLPALRSLRSRMES